LVLEDGIFETLDGQEFSKTDVQNYAQNRVLTQEEVVNNPIWQSLARNPELLKTYAGEIFSQAQTRFKRDHNMGVYVTGAPKEPLMRAWLLASLRDGDISDAGGGSLGGGSGRLVGVSGGATRIGVEAVELEKLVSQAVFRPSSDEILAVINNPDLNREGMIRAVSELYEQ